MLDAVVYAVPFDFESLYHNAILCSHLLLFGAPTIADEGHEVDLVVGNIADNEI